MNNAGTQPNHQADKPQRIVRAPRNEPYFAMPRATAQDRKLSFEARGVLSYLLSKPNDWELKPHDLQQECGRGKVYKILQELEEAHYLTRCIIRDKGRLAGWEYQVHATPCVENQHKVKGSPRDDLPYAEKPYAENRHVTYKREEQNLEFTETEYASSQMSTSDDDAAAAPAASKPDGANNSPEIDPSKESIEEPLQSSAKVSPIATPAEWLDWIHRHDMAADFVLHLINRDEEAHGKAWSQRISLSGYTFDDVLRLRDERSGIKREVRSPSPAAAAEQSSVGLNEFMTSLAETAARQAGKPFDRAAFGAVLGRAGQQRVGHDRPVPSTVKPTTTVSASGTVAPPVAAVTTGADGYGPPIPPSFAPFVGGWWFDARELVPVLHGSVNEGGTTLCEQAGWSKTRANGYHGGMSKYTICLACLNKLNALKTADEKPPTFQRGDPVWYHFKSSSRYDLGDDRYVNCAAVVLSVGKKVTIATRATDEQTRRLGVTFKKSVVSASSLAQRRRAGAIETWERDALEPPAPPIEAFSPVALAIAYGSFGLKRIPKSRQAKILDLEQQTLECLDDEQRATLAADLPPAYEWWATQLDRDGKPMIAPRKDGAAICMMLERWRKRPAHEEVVLSEPDMSRWEQPEQKFDNSALLRTAHGQHWIAYLGQLQIQLNAATYATWCKHLVLLSIDVGETVRFVVQAPHHYVLDWVEKNLLENMNKALSQICRCEAVVEVRLTEDVTESSEGDITDG